MQDLRVAALLLAVAAVWVFEGFTFEQRLASSVTVLAVAIVGLVYQKLKG